MNDIYENKCNDTVNNLETAIEQIGYYFKHDNGKTYLMYKKNHKENENYISNCAFDTEPTENLLHIINTYSLSSCNDSYDDDTKIIFVSLIDWKKRLNVMIYSYTLNIIITKEN